MGGAVPAVFSAIGGGIGALATTVNAGADDEDADLVAAWVNAEVLAAAALMESAAAAHA